MQVRPLEQKTARARLPCNQPGRANKAVIRGGEGRRQCAEIFFQGPARVQRGRWARMVGNSAVLRADRKLRSSFVPSFLDLLCKTCPVPGNSSRCRDIPTTTPRRGAKLPTCAVQRDGDSSELPFFDTYLRGREILMVVGLPLLMPGVSRFMKMSVRFHAIAPSEF